MPSTTTASLASPQRRQRPPRRAALATQHVSVNIDPSDRYVQSVPGSDKYRLRPDESGYDNLVLAGDWTDSRHQRRLHRGRGDVGPSGGQRTAGPWPLSPHPRLLHALRSVARCARAAPDMPPHVGGCRSCRCRRTSPTGSATRSTSTASQSGAAQILSLRSSPVRIRSASAIAISAPIRCHSGSWTDARCRCHSGISGCRVSHGDACVSLSSAFT